MTIRVALMLLALSGQAFAQTNDGFVEVERAHSTLQDDSKADGSPLHSDSADISIGAGALGHEADQALHAAAFGDSSALRGGKLPDKCAGGDCLSSVGGKGSAADGNGQSQGLAKPLPAVELDPTFVPGAPLPPLEKLKVPEDQQIYEICPECPPPPPMPTPEHPATPAMTSAYQSSLQSALSSTADRAERGGDAATASLLSAYASQPDRAARLAAQALARDPGDRKALTAMMIARQQQGRGDEARALARRALAADPQNTLAKIVAGTSGSLDKGAALQRKFGKLDLGKTAETAGAGGGLQGLFGSGAPDSQGSRSAGAAAAAVAAGGLPAAAAPANAPVSGARPAAVPGGDFGRTLTPAQQLVVRAVRMHEIGDEQGAMLALTQAVDHDPKEAAAFVVRAEVDNSLTKFTQAIVDATKGVELAPTRPVLTARALRARAYANLELKQWTQALADASASVEQDPKSGLGYLYRAFAEDKLGRGTAVSDDVVQALKLDPALTPLAKPLLAKYSLQAPGAPKPARRWPLVAAYLGSAGLLLGVGVRRLFRSPRGLTTTAAQRLRESTPIS